ncbi:MAG TPA: 50S ribosomal protein L11 methyltransferase [Solirubrobacteraceae bacterium]|nr:50S ribosomal protein L11 methyltransferase [Solirubrobacteraceae bacterium]
MIRLALRVRRADAELVLAALLDLAPSGVEEVDEGEIVEYAVYGAAGELPQLAELRAAAGGGLVDIVSTEVADDWGERWREFHQPVEIGSGTTVLRVRAPWHEPREGDLVIDPGQAFGTGAHATTKLCLELMTGVDPATAAGRVLDLGCGSGVLAIAAGRLGWGVDGGILAVDFDELAVAATAENAAANRVGVEAARFDLRDENVPAVPVVLANLLRPLLLTARFAQPPRLLIASGLLAEEGDEVSAHLASTLGLRERRRLEAGGWVALELS